MSKYAMYWRDNRCYRCGEMFSLVDPSSRQHAAGGVSPPVPVDLEGSILQSLRAIVALHDLATEPALAEAAHARRQQLLLELRDLGSRQSVLAALDRLQERELPEPQLVYLTVAAMIHKLADTIWPESNKELWQCPQCGGILEKQRETMLIKDAVGALLGSTICAFCSTAVPIAGVYAGQFDFADTDASIRRMCSDRDNMRFDSDAQRWRRKGQLVPLASDVPQSGQGEGRPRRWWHFWKWSGRRRPAATTARRG